MFATLRQPPPAGDADRANRSAALDGMRALAALSVLVFHVWIYGSPAPHTRDTFAEKLMFEGSLGLICFFVLSGYLLYRGFARAALTAGKAIDVRKYTRRRVARIVPAYYVCLVGSIVLIWISGVHHLMPDPATLPLFAAFMQNYSPQTLMSLNPVTWTLAVEAAFYVVLPLFGLLALRLGPRRPGAQALMLAALIPLTIGWNALVYSFGWNDVAAKALPAYLAYFALGMLVASWAERRCSGGRTGLNAGTTGALVAGAFALIAGQALWRELGPVGTMAQWLVAYLPAAIGFALAIAAVVGGRGPAVRWLSVRPLAGLGLISYGIYLWHLPMLLAARGLGLLDLPTVPRLAVVLALTIPVAAASWRWIERPMIERAARTRRHRNRRSAAARPRLADARAGS